MTRAAPESKASVFNSLYHAEPEGHTYKPSYIQRALESTRAVASGYLDVVGKVVQ